ncbi:MAG: hypothetical protein ACKO23_12430, partial [Gemmataceae bacterium]
LAAVSGCGPRLEDYHSEEGRFHIRLPGQPRSDPNPDLPRGIRSIVFMERSGSFTLAWEKLAAGKEDPQRLLDEACKGAVEKLKGKELSRKKIELPGGHPGRELMVEWPERKGVTLQRIYLVDRQLYNVVASGTAWWIESDPVRAVMNSFRLEEG